MQNTETPSLGTLYIVATPIGNLEDITLRALRTLKEVDLIAAEDTRHTKKLLNHFSINSSLISYYREKEQERGAVIIRQLLEGKNVALVSDAGTPAISDPGAVLVQLAHDSGITVCPIPGASALTAAICSSGFPHGSFLFIGFPPSKASQRKKLLTSLAHADYPIVFYESPRRVASFLRDALETFGDRPTLWARELTKSYEELNKTTISLLIEQCGTENSRGEFVIVVGPDLTPKAEGDNIEELLIWYRDHSGMSLKDSCRQLSKDLGLSRSQIYQQALEIWNN